MAGPVLSGALQFTDRLVFDAGATVGASGLPGFSVTSVTLMVTVMLSVSLDVSVAVTVTV